MSLPAGRLGSRRYDGILRFACGVINGVVMAINRISMFLGAAAVAALLFLPAPNAVSADRAASSAEGAGVGRIGYVDFNRALNEVSDGKRAKQRLKDEFEEKQAKLDRLQSELKALKDGIDRDRLIVSEEALRRREEEYQRKFNELQNRLDGFRMEMSTREHNLTNDILSRLRSIVKEIGRDEGYVLILEKSQDVVLYSQDGGDLTDRVISAYDRGRGTKK